MKLISNKDGDTGRRGETFASYCPNSYRVEDADGLTIGEFSQHIRKRGPHRDIEWMGSIHGEFCKFQRLCDVRNYLKTGYVPQYAIAPTLASIN